MIRILYIYPIYVNFCRFISIFSRFAFVLLLLVLALVLNMLSDAPIWYGWLMAFSYLCYSVLFWIAEKLRVFSKNEIDVTAPMNKIFYIQCAVAFLFSWGGSAHFILSQTIIFIFVMGFLGHGMNAEYFSNADKDKLNENFVHAIGTILFPLHRVRVV